MRSAIVAAAALQTSLAAAAAIQPAIQSNVPSIHPLTGPAPPEVPPSEHGEPKEWSAPEQAGQPAGYQSQAAGKYWTGWRNVQKLFVFGDSYTQTGFDPSQAQPSATNPLGNPAYPGYTSSNGPNWVDYLTVEYNQSRVQTYNLAYGGATVDADLVQPYQPTVLSLEDQVNKEFFPYYVSKTTAGWTSANSLFAFWIGINDIGNSYYNQDATINGKIINVYAGLIDELYQAGARNFMFLNVPPVERAPLTAAYGAATQQLEANDIADFNNRIQQMARNFSTYADSTVFYVDTNTVFDQVLDNPKSHPQTSIYRNTTSYCAAYQNGTPAQDTFTPSCGIPVNQYFWLNSLHPTSAVHEVLAEQIARQLGGSAIVQ